MAILKSQFPVTGSIGEFSFYKVRGSDKIIVRRKGGPSKKEVLKSERFALTRLNMAEFRGRVKASQLILRALSALRHLTDYSVANALHKPIKAIQDLDSVSPKGKRKIEFSRKPALLEGLPLNKKNPLDSLIRTSIVCSFHKETVGATVSIPEIIPDVNFFIPRQYPYYRIIVCVALVPDLHFHDANYVPAPGGISQTLLLSKMTQWHQGGISAPALTFDIRPEQELSEKAFTYIVSVGIEFGVSSARFGIDTVKHQGAGKILRTASISLA